MYESSVIAEPYANAAFATALEHNELNAWSQFFNLAAVIAKDKQVIELVHHPRTRAADVISLFEGLCKEQLTPRISNFIKLLVEKSRLLFLPKILYVFENMRAEHDKRIQVQVIVTHPLSDNQQERLAKALRIRMQREVQLETTIDESLLGGAIVCAGDEVIDGSVKNKLNRLTKILSNHTLGVV